MRSPKTSSPSARSADAVTGGLRDPAKATISSFSSWGPTDDGRIKPDVVANGEALYSSLNGSNTSYGSYSGTSMATPNATRLGRPAHPAIRQLVSRPGDARQHAQGPAHPHRRRPRQPRPRLQIRLGSGQRARPPPTCIMDHQAYPAKQRLTENQLTTTHHHPHHSFVWDGVRRSSPPSAGPTRPAPPPPPPTPAPPASSTTST